MKVENSMINDYLYYRNLYINRKYASSKEKIKTRPLSMVVQRSKKKILISNSKKYIAPIFIPLLIILSLKI